MPSGWFRIATSDELRRGEVGVFRASGRELVAFRTERGEVAVFDPFCPHMGAHLGHGGKVRRDALRCPFHGLRFDIHGRCVGTEYPGNPNVDLSIRTWPCVEQLGCVFVYVDVGSSPPTWTLPDYEIRGWTRPVTKVLTLRGHVQDVAENAVDFGHFAVVHGYSKLEDPTLRVDGPRLHSKFGFSRRNPLWPKGEVRATFDTMVHGLGLSDTDLRAPQLGIHYRVVLTATQLDANTMSFGIGVSSKTPPPFVPASLRRLPIPWSAAARAQIRVIHPFIVSDVLQDEAIWAHRTPMKTPALIPGDGPIAKFRRWVQQFYACVTPRA